MKKLLISLLLLGCVPVYSSKKAPQSSSAAVASESEADTKSDLSHYSLEQIAQTVIPAVNGHIPPACTWHVADYLVQSPADLIWLLSLKAAHMLASTYASVQNAAIPQPGWQALKNAIEVSTGTWGNGQYFLPVLSLVVADYAQHDLRPIAEIFDAVVTPEVVKEWQAEAASVNSTVEAINTTNGPALRNMDALREQHGIVFPGDRASLDMWNRLGFVFLPDQFRRMTCTACGPRAVHYGPPNRMIYPGGCRFGDVDGSFVWRKPLYYHRPECENLEKVRQEIAQKLDGCSELSLVKYGENVPSIRENPLAFLPYVLLHLDLYANAHKPYLVLDEPSIMRDRAIAWESRLGRINAMRYSRNVGEYLQDPEGWIAQENKRAEELASSVRYPVTSKKTD